MGIALLVLEDLRSIEMNKGVGYVTVDELLRSLSRRIDGISRDELDFILETLAQEREIHYATANENHVFDLARTRTTTNLVHFADSREQLKLTENGRLFLRICDHEQAWLYSDSDTKKLVTALTYNKFNDIPVLCASIGQDLAAKGAMLADLINRPTRQEQSDLLISDGKGIGEMLNNAKEIVKNAMNIAFEINTCEEFERWQLKEKSDLSIGNIQAELETLLRVVEAVTRKFTEFIMVAQHRRDVATSERRFLRMVDQLVPSCTSHSANKMERFMESILFPRIDIPYFHPSVIPGEIDFYGLAFSDKSETLKSFDINAVSVDPPKRFSAFVERNRHKLMELLEDGPVSFSKIVATDGFDLLPGESLLDFIGVYVAPESLIGSQDGEYRLVVGFSNEDMSYESDDSVVTSSDPEVFLQGLDEK